MSMTEKNLGGRPPLYKPELADEVIERLASGEHIVDICDDPKMPSHDTVQRWVEADLDGFASRYEKAMESKADRLGKKIEELGQSARSDAVRLRALVFAAQFSSKRYRKASTGESGGGNITIKLGDDADDVS